MGDTKMNQPSPRFPRGRERKPESYASSVFSCLVSVGCLENSPGRSLYQMGWRPHAPLVPREITLRSIIRFSWNTSLGINTQQKGVCPPARCTVCSGGCQPSWSLLPIPPPEPGCSGRGRRLRHRRTVPAQATCPSISHYCVVPASFTPRSEATWGTIWFVQQDLTRGLACSQEKNLFARCVKGGLGPQREAEGGLNPIGRFYSRPLPTFPTRATSSILSAFFFFKKAKWYVRNK